jgi:hypothetical protein
MYYNQCGYGDSYKDYYPDPKSSHVEIKKISCVDSNINVNGIDVTQIPQEPNGLATAEATNEDRATNIQNGNGLGDRNNFYKNLVNICVNININEQDSLQRPLSGGDHPNP